MSPQNDLRAHRAASPDTNDITRLAQSYLPCGQFTPMESSRQTLECMVPKPNIVMAVLDSYFNHAVLWFVLCLSSQTRLA